MGLLNLLCTAFLAAFAFTFCLIDANPSLWLFDKLFVSPKRIRSKFASKRIWITGASGGIGAELALQLAACDASVVISARNEKKLQQLAERCSACNENAQVQVLPLDVDMPQAKLEKLVEQVGPVDCVVLNAGIAQQCPAAQVSREETERVFRINTFAPIHFTQTLLQQPTPPNHFVVTSSVVAKGPVPLSTSYAASKHAVDGYFKSLMVEQPSLRIDLPCPGPVATRLFGTEPNANERKMEARRCARLILATMLSSGGETWIAQQPTLTFFYLQQFLPGFSFWFLQTVVGPIRTALWENGLNLFDPSSLAKLKALRKEQKSS